MLSVLLYDRSPIFGGQPVVLVPNSRDVRFEVIDIFARLYALKAADTFSDIS